MKTTSQKAVGDARARRVHQVHQWDAQSASGFLNAQDFLDGAFAPRTSLDSLVVGHDGHLAAADRPAFFLESHHIGQHLVFGDRVAGLDMPLHQFDFGNAFADIRHLDYV